MNPKRAAFFNIVISIIFAVAIILSSHLLKDSEHSQTVLYLLIAMWWIPFSLLTIAGVKGEK